MSLGPQTFSPATRRTGVPSTWWWFLVPLFTFGFASFVMVLIGALKLKSKPNLYAAIGYFTATVAYFCGVALTTDPNADPNAEPSMPFALVSVSFLIAVWLGGTAHTALLQHVVGKLDPEPALASAIRAVPHSPDPALAAAAWRLSRRQEARQLLATSPAMAWELKIGRPDITGRQYDDGGLVDMNHVAAEWLAYALQIPRSLADEIVTVRDQRQGFTSSDELIVYCESVTPEMLAMISDLMIFRPL